MTYIYKMTAYLQAWADEQDKNLPSNVRQAIKELVLYVSKHGEREFEHSAETEYWRRRTDRLAELLVEDKNDTAPDPVNDTTPIK